MEIPVSPSDLDSIVYNIIERIYELDDTEYYDSIVYSSNIYEEAEKKLAELLANRRVDNNFMLVEI